MASAYVGSTFLPPLFGLLAGRFSTQLYPCYLAVFLLLFAAMTEQVNRVCHPADAPAPDASGR